MVVCLDGSVEATSLERENMIAQGAVAVSGWHQLCHRLLHRRLLLLLDLLLLETFNCLRQNIHLLHECSDLDIRGDHRT